MADAARQLYDNLGYPVLGATYPKGLLKSRRTERWLAVLDSIAVFDLPRDARLAELEITRITAGGDTSGVRCRGWLLREEADSISFVTSSTGQMNLARVDTLVEAETALQTARVRQVSPSEGLDLWEGERWYWNKAPQPRDISAHGVSVVRWLAANGQDSLFAEKVGPLMDPFPTDEAFLMSVRNGYADVYGYRMFSVYAGDRNLPETLVMAELCRRLYPGTYIAEVAERLCQEIPRRREDFGEFRLPTPREWETIRGRLSHRKELDYLCARLRLLNWVRYGEGTFGLSAYSTQYAEADLPIIARHFVDDWLTLGITMGHVETTSDLLADVINVIAGEEIFDWYHPDDYTPAELEEATGKVIRWARENGRLTEQERILKRVRETEQFRKVPLYRFDRLTAEQRAGAVPDLLRFLARDDLGDYARRTILESCLEWNGATCLGAADTLIGDNEAPAVQLLAGLIVARHGDHDRGLDAVASAIARGTYRDLYGTHAGLGAEALLAEGSEDRYRQAAVLFSGEYLSRINYKDSASVLKAFIRARRPDAYAWLLKALADSTHESGEGEGLLQRCDFIADLCVQSILPEDAGYTYDFNAPFSARVEARRKILAWVEGRLEEMTGGK